MNQTQTTAFFTILHDLEDASNLAAEAFGADISDRDPEYTEGYDYAMDIVKDAIISGDVKDAQELSDFIDQADAYAEDEGEYGEGYQDAVNHCLEAVSQLLASEEG